MGLGLVVIAMVVSTLSGMPGMMLARRSAWGEPTAMAMMVVAALAGLAGAVAGLGGGTMDTLAFPWQAAADSLIGLDALSAFFLVPVLVMGALGSIYSLDYWPARSHPGNARRVRLFWGLLVAGMCLLVISRHAMAFLLGWEVMALAAFFLVATEDHRRESRRAAWIYLAATHTGTLLLFGMFALWRSKTGGYLLAPVAVEMTPAVRTVFFVVGLVAFGLKAGMMPLHFWLPGAHAAAPSHVSAMLSGVVLKMGIYGLVRWYSLFPHPPAFWGAVVLALGVVSGLLGVVFAIAQHDLKRLLAYHSVENIGIILMGLGLALLGQSFGKPVWVVLGLSGCLLHTWNHALFKSLLFLCAGSVLHATHSRQLGRQGGLAKRMPWTAAMFLVGAVAICGLPPLNGFVSEFLIYLGLFGTITNGDPSGPAMVLAAPVLAMIGALAVACFAKVYGTVFLGEPRTSAAAHAHESAATMRASMVVLALGCVVIGYAPLLLVPVLENAARAWSRVDDMPSVRSAAPLGLLTPIALALTLCAAVMVLFVRGKVRAAHRTVTWDCGYARPAPRMQYTPSSFAQMIVLMFGWVLRPRIHRPHVAGLFPRATKMESHVDDAVLDRVLTPAGGFMQNAFAWCHRFQQGVTQHYVLYILITVIVMLGTLMPVRSFLARVFLR